VCRKVEKVKGTAKIWVSPSIVKKEEVRKQIFQEFHKFSLYTANVKKGSGENYTIQTSVLRFPKMIFTTSWYLFPNECSSNFRRL
jgi:hypothetical protein